MNTPVTALACVAAATLMALTAVSCSSTQDSEAETLIARAGEAMASRSFSVTTSCSTCDDGMTTLEYAPPDRIKLSNAPGHDAWKFNLIVGDSWYNSSSGERWRDGVTLQHIGMVLGDVRVLLKYAREPAIQDDEALRGAEHYVLAMRVDASRLVNEVVREKVGSQSAEDEEGLGAYGELIGGLRLRFWIEKETFVVSQIELDYPPFPQEFGEESEDPQPIIFSFDFESPVDLPTDPISLPPEEIRRLNDIVEERVWVIRGAVNAYKEEFGSDPPHADQDVLGEFLSAGWPINPITNEPVVQSAIFSPGNFCYNAGDDDEPYRFAVYGWDHGLYSTIPGCRVLD